MNEAALAIANESTDLIEQVSESTIRNLQASTTEATKRRYRTAWAGFSSWCDSRSAQAMPATTGTVADYLSHLKDEGKKPATIQLALSAIGTAHESQGFDPPTKSLLVKTTLKGIQRQVGRAQKRAKAALKEDIWLMLQALPDDARGIRDRALLLIGFNAAMRRSELVALDVEDIEKQDRGLLVRIRRSKTDQDAQGRDIAIPQGRTDATCAMLSLQKWLDHARIESGAIFRSIDRHGRIAERLTPQSVRLIVRDRCKAAGIDPRPYSGHSLRAGFATSAALAGSTETEIMQTTGHQSSATLKRYIRVADLWRNNAAEKVGL